MGVGGFAEAFPIGGFGCIFDETGVEVADAPGGKSKWVFAGELVEVVVDELPVERGVIGEEDGAAVAVLFEPLRKVVHNFFGLIKGEMLFAGEAADGESFGQELFRDWRGASVESGLHCVVDEDCAEADHGIFVGNGAVGFDVYDNVRHVVILGW